MEDNDKKDNQKNNNNRINIDENGDDDLDLENLNINQEVDIKENPKKHIVNTKKQNILKNNNYDISDNNKKHKKSKRIAYEDIYLGNDMFFSAPKSYPRDYEKNNKFILEFTKTSYGKSSSNINLIIVNENSNFKNKSQNLNITEDDDNDDDDIGIIRSNSYEFFCQKGESSHLKDFLTSLNNHRINAYYDLMKQEDNKFIDEDENQNQNIFYIQNEKELNNLNYYNKKK